MRELCGYCYVRTKCLVWPLMWFKVDDGLAFHRKTIAAGNAAMGLWVRAGSWCGQHLTDGHIPLDVVKTMGTIPQADRLVRAQLWLQTDTGYQFHDWQDSNPTREEVVSGRKNEANRKKIWRDTRKILAKNPETPRSEAPVPRQVSHPMTQDTGSGRGSSTRSDLTSTSDYKREQPATTMDGLKIAQEHFALCSHTPPREVQGRTFDAIERLVAEGLPEGVIRAALKLMRERPRTGPGLLPDLAYEVQKGAAGPALSTRHQRAQGAIDAGRRVQSMVNGQKELE